MKSKVFVVFSFAVLVFIVLWEIYLQSIPEKTTIFNYLFNSGIGISYLVAGITGIFLSGKFLSSPKIGRALKFMGFGIFAYGTGWIIWTYYNLILKIDIPVPSIADIFFILLFVPLTAYGLGQIVSYLSQKVEAKHILYGLLVFLASFLLVFGFVMTPEFSADLTAIQNIVNAAYPVTDSILLALSIIIILTGTVKRNLGFAVLAIALLLQVIADVFYSYRVASGLYWNGDIADALYSLPSFLLTVSFIAIYSAEASSLENKWKA